MPNSLKNILADFTRCALGNFLAEGRTALRDQGVMIFFFIVPLAYPLLYCFIYTNEAVREVPVVAIDNDRSAQSREFLRNIDATPDAHIVAYASDMEEAKTAMKRREAYGIINVPRTFAADLAAGKQTTVSAFSDMSSMLYYKAVYTSAMNASLKMNAKLKVERTPGATQEQARVVEHPIEYEDICLYNPQNGFASFLIPAVLILVLQQTLLLGIGMAAGTRRERNPGHLLVPAGLQTTNPIPFVLGKAAMYLMIYLPLSIYVLVIVPRLFSLNHLFVPHDLALFIVPFLLAAIFFAITLSGLIRHRETSIMLIVFTSVLLLFISGVSWPQSALPAFWRTLACIFPSTYGIHGFVAMNNAGARLSDLTAETAMLWLQTAIYFCTACAVYWQALRSSKGVNSRASKCK